MISTIIYLFLLGVSVSQSLSINEIDSIDWAFPSEPAPSSTNLPGGSPKSLTQLALAVARSSYLPIDRFMQNGSIIENPSPFGENWFNCPKDKPVMQAGLCYKSCDKSTWAAVKGVGPLCWGCPKSHPVEHGALCYKKCPKNKATGRMFLCFGDCPSGYRNDGLTCFRKALLQAADTASCPWYDICGLTFSSGCSKCPAGYKNDGCTCRRNPHVTIRPRYHRGIGVAMKYYVRGVGVLPELFRYERASEQVACQIKGWVGTAFVNENTEVVKFVNPSQKITVFGFRGTEMKSVSDWLANFDFIPENFWINGTRLTAHRGFKNRYDSIASWFEKEYMNTPKEYMVLLTGHSQGGALASIAAVFAAGKLARAPNAVITWGSLQIGAPSFRKFYRNHVGCHVTVNYVTKGDIVATLPRIHDYAHVCEVFELDPGQSNFIQAYSLYSGYGKGVQRLYRDTEDMKSGCDVSMSTENEVSPDDLLAYYSS